MEFPHPGHEKHLCKIWSDKYNIDEVRDIIKDPKFICKVCGRVAANDENLCDPASL